MCVVTRVALSQVSHTPDIIPNRRPGRHSPQRACDPVYRQTVDRRDRWRPNLPRPSFAWGLAAARRRPPELRHALGLTAPQAVLGAAEEERGDMHQRQHLRGDQGPPGSARRAPSKASAAPEDAPGRHLGPASLGQSASWAALAGHSWACLRNRGAPARAAARPVSGRGCRTGCLSRTRCRRRRPPPDPRPRH